MGLQPNSGRFSFQGVLLGLDAEGHVRTDRHKKPLNSVAKAEKRRCEVCE